MTNDEPTSPTHDDCRVRPLVPGCIRLAVGRTLGYSSGNILKFEARWRDFTDQIGFWFGMRGCPNRSSALRGLTLINAFQQNIMHENLPTVIPLNCARKRLD